MSETLCDEEDLAQLTQMTERDFGVWGSGEPDLWYPNPRSQHTPLPSKDLALQYVNCEYERAKR